MLSAFCSAEANLALLQQKINSFDYCIQSFRPYIYFVIRPNLYYLIADFSLHLIRKVLNPTEIGLIFFPGLLTRSRGWRISNIAIPEGLLEDKVRAENAR